MTEQAYYTMWFFVGVILLSAGVSYAWWTKVRVLWLRQDIYDLRDELFMASARYSLTHDEAAKSARDHLNTLARIAPVISIPFVVTAIRTGVVEVRELPRSDDTRLDSLIKEAMNKADRRIARYLAKETLTGWLFVILSRVVLMTWLLQALGTWVQQWRESSSAEDALHMLERGSRQGGSIAAQPS